MAVSIFTMRILMNEYIMKGLLHFVRFREILLFHISFFPSWRIFYCKKKMLCQNSCTLFEPQLVELKKWTYSSILSSRVAQFFSWGVMMEWLSVEKVEVIWRREKKMVENKATLDSIIARFEDGWWKKSGLWPSPRFDVPMGRLCLATLPNCCWITNLFFWDT